MVAMQEGLEVAVEKINKRLTQQNDMSLTDQAVIDLLQAELFYTNAQSCDSVNIFDTKLMPIFKKLPDEVQMAILYNKNTASLTAMASDAHLDFYYLQDYRKFSGLDPWKSSNLLTAHNLAEEGRHYEALPKYWTHLLFTFNQGIWDSQANAYAIISKEFMSLNWLPKSAHYAIMSHNTKSADIIYERLINSGNINFIEQTLDFVLTKAQLLRHASVACKIIEGICDEIPNAYIDRTTDYLLRICSNKRKDVFEIHPISNAWKAIKSIAHRLSSQKACEVLDVVTNHEWFNSFNTNRRHLIETVDNLIDILPKNKLMALSKKMVPLLEEKKSDIDYTHVVNLLLHIAFKDGGKVKKYLSRQLYSKDKPLSSVLGRVAKHFDAKIKIDNPQKSVEIVSQNIVLQVQRLKEEEEPQKVFDTYGTITKVDNNIKEKIIVQMSSNSSLQMLTANINLLKSAHKDMLVNAFVRMIREPDNLLSNKVGIINVIIELADKLTKKQKQKLFIVLKPLASGLVVESSVVMSHDEASNPLNTVKMNDTKPEVICGGALYALACLERSHPNIYGVNLNKLIKKALINKNPTIREHAYWAIMEIPNMDDEFLIDVLFGTRDSNCETAIAAYNIILRRKDINLTAIYWYRLFLSLHEAVYSEDKKLRLLVASNLNNLIDKSPKEYKGKIEELRETLKSDICYSVRSAL